MPPIKEYKTHFEATKNCSIVGHDIVVQQLKDAREFITAQCNYFHMDGACHADFDPNDSHSIRYFKPKQCLLFDKLVEKID